MRGLHPSLRQTARQAIGRPSPGVFGSPTLVMRSTHDRFERPSSAPAPKAIMAFRRLGRRHDIVLHTLTPTAPVLPDGIKRRRNDRCHKEEHHEN
jgi:hypothetical protein